MPDCLPAVRALECPSCLRAGAGDEALLPPPLYLLTLPCPPPVPSSSSSTLNPTAPCRDTRDCPVSPPASAACPCPPCIRLPGRLLPAVDTLESEGLLPPLLLLPPALLRPCFFPPPPDDSLCVIATAACRIASDSANSFLCHMVTCVSMKCFAASLPPSPSRRGCLPKDPRGESLPPAPRFGTVGCAG